jgi:ubiquinone/menaquinone biosynthesis C-methylase UbiE
MSEKYKDKEGLKYSQMDAKAMNFHEGEFDAILDKATLDSVLVII